MREMGIPDFINFLIGAMEMANKEHKGHKEEKKMPKSHKGSGHKPEHLSKKEHMKPEHKKGKK